MEFSFKPTEVLEIDSQGFAILDSSKFNCRGSTVSTPYYLQTYAPKLDSTKEKLADILDRMGEASSKVSIISISNLK
jgi:hypothetical protein